MSRLIYSAPILAALLAFIYARYNSYAPSITLPFSMTQTSTPTSASSPTLNDQKPRGGESVLMDQIVLFGGESPHCLIVFLYLLILKRIYQRFNHSGSLGSRWYRFYYGYRIPTQIVSKTFAVLKLLIGMLTYSRPFLS